MYISEIVDTVTAHNGVHSILLFGSFIKGEATKDSDIDICIIEERGLTFTIKDKFSFQLITLFLRELFSIQWDDQS